MKPEACIGIAKHWSYSINNHGPADAYTAFETISKNGQQIELLEWRKIIGMRNALVHDYLNIQPDLIRGVIKNETYTSLFEFANIGLLELSE